VKVGRKTATETSNIPEHVEAHNKFSERISIGWLRKRLFFFSGFLDLRPVSAASDLQPWIYGGLEIRIYNSKTPV
jgi:hypothetical protein